MNIQIFGKNKCFETKKAERYFKERRIKYQFINLDKYGISPGEYKSIKAALGGINALIDKSAKEYEGCFIPYLSGEAAIEEKLLNNPGLFKTPIVRNGRRATVGYAAEIWKIWEKE